MKKLFLLLAISPLLVACGQAKQDSASTSTASPKTIVVATAGDIPPFDFEKDGSLTGYDVEVLKAVDEKLDQYKIEFQKTAWESIFPGVDAGRYQAAANNLSYTKERADKYLYSLPIAKKPLVLVSRKDKALTSSLVKQPRMILELLLPRLLRTGIKATPTILQASNTLVKMWLNA